MDAKLIKKLHLKKEHRGLILNCPDDLLDAFKGLDFEINLKTASHTDYLIIFSRDLSDLRSLLPLARQYHSPDIRLWLSYPKKSGNIDSDLNRDTIWNMIDEVGYSPNRMVSMNENWSLMSLGDKKKLKKKSTFGQDPPGVDRVAKTVIPPEDLQQAFRKHPEAEAFFNSLAFSHKREYVGWIHDAKKAETRKRRVIKTIELLAAGQKTK